MLSLLCLCGEDFRSFVTFLEVRLHALTELQDHVKSECTKRLVNCPNLAQGCVETVPLDEVEEHLAKSCRKRVVECRLDCGLRFACDRRSEHEVRIVMLLLFGVSFHMVLGKSCVKGTSEVASEACMQASQSAMRAASQPFVKFACMSHSEKHTLADGSSVQARICLSFHGLTV